MTLVEFLGFLFALLAIGFSIFQRLWQEYVRRKYPEKHAERLEHEKHKRRELLKAMGLPAEEEEEEEEEESTPAALPSPILRKAKQKVKTTHRLLSDDFEFEAKLDSFKPKSRIEGRKMESHVGERYGNDYGNELVSAELQGDNRRLARGRKKGKLMLLRVLKKYEGARAMIISNSILNPPPSA